MSLPAEARGEYYAAALTAFIVFAAMGLFAGLAGLSLVVSLDRPSHALLGATLFAVFAAAVIAQPATMTWPLRRLLAAGTAAMLVGLAAGVALAEGVSPRVTPRLRDRGCGRDRRLGNQAVRRRARSIDESRHLA